MFFSSGKNKGRLSGPGDMSRHLWHYEESSSYKEFDERDSGLFSFGKQKSSFSSDTKLTHYMAAGGMRYENAMHPEAPRHAISRGKIIKWLVILALVWTIFRFVSI